MTSRKRFKEYANSQNLNESGLISKGFALGQRSRFLSTKSSLESKLSSLKSALKSAELSGDPKHEIKALLIAFIQLTEIIDVQAEMQSNIMNTVVAITLFHEGTKK